MSILILFDSSSRLIRGSSNDKVDFSFTVNVVGKTLSTVSINGSTIQKRWSGTYQKSIDNIVTSFQISPTTGNPLRFSSNNENVATIDQSGNVVSNSAGLATLVATDPALGSVGASTIINVANSGFLVNSVSFIDSNSVGSATQTLMKGYIDSLSPSQYTDQYFSQWSNISLQQLTPVVSDNPTFIGNDLDLSWVSLYRESPDGTIRNTIYTGHLISPRHLIMANHVQYGPGEKAVFRTKTGSIQKVTVLQYNWIADDVGVVYLDADVVDIEPVMFPSEPIRNYNFLDEGLSSLDANIRSTIAVIPGLSTISTNNEVLCFGLVVNKIPNAYTEVVNGQTRTYDWKSPNPLASFVGGRRHLTILNLLNLTKNSGPILPPGYPSGSYLFFDKPTSSYKNFSCDIYGGDSSSPIFIPITVNNQTKCLLLTTLHGPTSGPSYTDHMPDIVDMMNKQALNHGDTRTYALNTVDLKTIGYRRYTQGFSDLSPAAQKVVQTFKKFGGTNGLMLSALRLNNQVHNQDDTAGLIYQMTGKKVAHIQWDYIDPGLKFFINQGLQAKATLDWTSGIQALKDHWNAGGTVGLGVTYPNFVTGGDWFDRRRSNFSEVSLLKEENSTSQAFIDYRAALDRLADMLNTQLIAADGTKIPVVLRMFGETNGWYDYLPGEGLDPEFQLPGRVLTGLSRQVGTSLYQLTFAPRPAHSPGIPGIGGTIQVEGTSNPAWSGRYTPYQVVSGNLATDPYNQPLTILAWKGGSNPTGSLDVSSGSAIAYESSGAWYAGRDRAEDLMVVIRETLDYLWFQKGCTHIINSTCLFPEQYWSTIETNKDRLGRTFDYSNWNPGENYVQMLGADYYTSTSAATTDKFGVISSLTKQRSLFDASKPFVMHELGFNMGFDSNQYTGPANTTVDFWSKEIAAIRQNLPFLSSIGIWDHHYIPATTDPAFPDFVSTVNNDLITLDKLNRIN